MLKQKKTSYVPLKKSQNRQHFCASTKPISPVFLYTVLLFIPLQTVYFYKVWRPKGIIEEPIDLKGMAERRNVTHNYKLWGSVWVCVWMQIHHAASVADRVLQCVHTKDVKSSDWRPAFHQSHPLIDFRRRYILFFKDFKPKYIYI